MIVVADSSALIALAVCDALPLLASVADEIVIPPAVFDEVVVEGRPHSGGFLALSVASASIS